MKFEAIIQLPNAWTMVGDRLGLHLFQDRCTVEDMAAMEAAGDRWMRRSPGRIVEMVVVHPSDNRMTSDERAKMVALIKRWEHVRAASATVILAEGVRGSLQRSILTGLMMVAPAPHPAKVFGAVQPALGYLMPHVLSLCSGTTDVAVRASVADVCGAFEQRAARTDRG